MIWYVYDLLSDKNLTDTLWYQLGVSTDADETALKKAYRRQAMKVCRLPVLFS